MILIYSHITQNLKTLTFLMAYPLVRPTSQASSFQPRDPSRKETHSTKKDNMNTNGLINYINQSYTPSPVIRV